MDGQWCVSTGLEDEQGSKGAGQCCTVQYRLPASCDGKEGASGGKGSPGSSNRAFWSVRERCDLIGCPRVVRVLDGSLMMRAICGRSKRSSALERVMDAAANGKALSRCVPLM